MEVESNPPFRNAWSISSKERAEIRTPDPNAMISAITLWGMGAIQARAFSDRNESVGIPKTARVRFKLDAGEGGQHA
jgi:hypothetical protein